MMTQHKSVDVALSANSFWTAVDILVNKPHVVNKRLWGCRIISYFNSNNLSAELSNYESNTRLETTSLTAEELQKLFPWLGGSISAPNSSADTAVLIELLPKTYSEPHAYQMICLSKTNNQVIFMNITPPHLKQNLCPEFPYMLRFHNNAVILEALCDSTSKSFQWLNDTVVPQFIKWGEATVNNGKVQQSLALVSAEEYYEKYNALKVKYGKEMVQIWPECTDPAKFVYEDIAIATYLLLIWEKERCANKTEQLQSFVDLGCGNGLLVYILTLEGHKGVGIDVRKRNIWDIYPKTVHLEEKTIIPSDLCLFPDTDWIIGNHSDELTPWIPVLSARSSYKCNFFLLPCCAYNFDGTKYQRHNASKSQYTEYLEYISSLCNDCGFNIETDRLKIPSTKRICIVSSGRKYPESEHQSICNNIQGIISGQYEITKNTLDNDGNNSWIKDFKPREGTEKVRNCTQLEKSLINSLISCVTRFLLEDIDMESNWSTGKAASFNDIVQLIPQSQLNELKSECGGLQTLLKNHHHIFKVQEGKVQLRYPRSIEDVRTKNKLNKNGTSNANIQKKPCWFFINHPQGCPLDNTICSFLHVKE